MPHQQIRTVPAASPPDLARFLKVLSDAKVNILAAGGGDIERGGEFAIAVDDDKIHDTVRILSKDYSPRVVDVDHKFLPNVPGALHGFVVTVAAQNKSRGMVIKDIAIGGQSDGRVLVQIYSEPA